MKLTSPDGQKLALDGVGLQVRTSVQKIDPIFARVIISQADLRRGVPAARATSTCSCGGTAGLARGRSRAEGFPDVEANSRAKWVDQRVEGINTLLNLLYVLLALSVIVSLFGMVNTLVLGGVRAHAGDRDAARRRHVAPAGAAHGPPGVGHHGADRRRARPAARARCSPALLSAALSSEGIAFAVPIGSLIAFTIVAIIAGVLAAIAPARRAARLDVLKALQYE